MPYVLLKEKKLKLPFDSARSITITCADFVWLKKTNAEDHEKESEQ